MKLSYPVRLSAIKHEYNPKEEYFMTTMHLELPGGVDLKMLQHIYRRFLKPTQGESGQYHIIFREKDGGAPYRVRVEGAGTKTKDFALFAVVKKTFNESDGFERYLDCGCFSGEEDQLDDVIFEAELVLPENLMEQAAREFVDSVENSGMQVTLSSSDKSVTVGKKKEAHDA